MTHDVFLSYSHADSALMTHIRDVLREAGLHIWVDDALIPGTPAWEREIEKAISESRVVIVLLSPAANKSDWVSREVAYADELRKTIIPIIGDAATDNGNDVVPLRLKTIQHIDLRNLSSG